MSNISNSKSASESVGDFIGEFLGKFGYLGSQPVTFISSKTQMLGSKNTYTKKVLDWIEKNQAIIAKTFFSLGCIFNFYYSPLLFLGGVFGGFLASASLSPIEFKTLEYGELLGHTKERGFATQKVMAILAGLNLYLGDTLLDNMFFGATGGLIAGNNLYHMVKDNAQFKEKLSALSTALHRKG